MFQRSLRRNVSFNVVPNFHFPSISYPTTTSTMKFQPIMKSFRPFTTLFNNGQFHHPMATMNFKPTIKFPSRITATTTLSSRRHFALKPQKKSTNKPTNEQQTHPEPHPIEPQPYQQHPDIHYQQQPPPPPHYQQQYQPQYGYIPPPPHYQQQQLQQPITYAMSDLTPLDPNTPIIKKPFYKRLGAWIRKHPFRFTFLMLGTFSLTSFLTVAGMIGYYIRPIQELREYGLEKYLDLVDMGYLREKYQNIDEHSPIPCIDILFTDHAEYGAILPRAEQWQEFIVYNLFYIEKTKSALEKSIIEIENAEKQLNLWLEPYKRKGTTYEEYSRLYREEQEKVKKHYNDNNLTPLKTSFSQLQYPETFVEYDIPDYELFQSIHLLRELIQHCKKQSAFLNPILTSLPLTAIFLRHNLLQNAQIQNNPDLIALKQHLPPHTHFSNTTDYILHEPEQQHIENWVQSLGPAIEHYEPIPTSSPKYIIGLPKQYETIFFVVGILVSAVASSFASNTINLTKVITTYTNTLTHFNFQQSTRPPPSLYSILNLLSYRSEPEQILLNQQLEPDYNQTIPYLPHSFDGFSTIESLITGGSAAFIANRSMEEVSNAIEKFPIQRDVLTHSHDSPVTTFVAATSRMFTPDDFTERFRSGAYNQLAMKLMYQALAKEQFKIDNHLPSNYKFGTNPSNEPPPALSYTRLFALPVPPSEFKLMQNDSQQQPLMFDLEKLNRLTPEELQIFNQPHPSQGQLAPNMGYSARFMHYLPAAAKSYRPILKQIELLSKPMKPNSPMLPPPGITKLQQLPQVTPPPMQPTSHSNQNI